jgi:hypothetical protein
MFSRTFPKTPLVVIIRTENDQKSRRQESRLKEETFVSRLHQQNHLSVVLAGGVLAILKRPI